MAIPEPIKPGPGPLADIVVAWQRRHGRHHLPWQGTRDPYRIWLSEIMLQQTQVATVTAYYLRFLQRFPDIAALAAATQDEVMPYWAGLGYYARARNLHRCAQVVVEQWGGAFPATSAQIAQLPGIGRSTAAAIAAFSYGERSPIMDGNVKRVFTRYFGIYGETSTRLTEQALWTTAETLLVAASPDLDMAAYTQGLMDLGSECCTRSRPDCPVCPLRDGCYAYRNDKQQELPTPKKKKASPERQCTMLILEHDGCILLELQPSPGIWGGLWSLPRYDDEPQLLAACADWVDAPARAQRMAALTHVFTHFRLHIEPWYLKNAGSALAPTLPDQTADSGQAGALPEVGPARRWVPIDALDAAALPAPVRKILDGLYGSVADCEARQASLPLCQP